MVKELDEKPFDHIGWRLWNAASIWKDSFTAEMVARGHGWYAEARSSVLPYINGDGTHQADIVRRMGVSKQAVQQLVADLEQAGIVERVPDPRDARAKIVRFTEAGQAAMRDARAAKRVVEDRMRATLGAQDFDRLAAILARLTDEHGG